MDEQHSNGTSDQHCNKCISDFEQRKQHVQIIPGKFVEEQQNNGILDKHRSKCISDCEQRKQHVYSGTKAVLYHNAITEQINIMLFQYLLHTCYLYTYT